MVISASPKYSSHLVVDRVLGISQIEDDGAVRTSTTTAVSKNVLKVNGSVETQRTVLVDIDPMALVITRGVENGDLQHVRTMNKT